MSWADNVTLLCRVYRECGVFLFLQSHCECWQYRQHVFCFIFSENRGIIGNRKEKTHPGMPGSFLLKAGE